MNNSTYLVLVVGDAINQFEAAGEEVLDYFIDRLSAKATTKVLSGPQRQVIRVLHWPQLSERLGHANRFATGVMAFGAIYERFQRTGVPALRAPAVVADPPTNRHPSVTIASCTVSCSCNW